MTQSAPNTKALTSRRGAGQGGGRPAPWQASMANGTALEEARAASRASKTCEEGRGCRRSFSCCRLLQRCCHRCPPSASMSSAHFNRGPAYGLSAEVKNKVGLEGLPPTWPTCPARPEAPHLGFHGPPSCLSHMTWNLREKKDEYGEGAAFLPGLSIPEPSAPVGV